MDVSEALKVFGLGTEATQEEIRQSYYDLVKVWHPDHFRNQPRLLLKAEAELMKINQAKEILEGYTPSEHKARATKPKAQPDSAPQYQTTAKKPAYQKSRKAASSNPNKTNTVPTAGRPSVKKIIGITIFIIFLLIRLIQYIDRHSNPNPTVPSSAVPAAPAASAFEPPSNSETATPDDVSPPLSDVPVQQSEQNSSGGDVCKNIIVDFINAEDTRNYSFISQSLSDRMERYWDLVNPSSDQIHNRYRHLWSITKYSKNVIKHIDKINETTYFVFTSYEYVGNKLHIVKTQDSRLTFVFDQNNKIVQIDGIVESETSPDNP